ncbi:MAG: transporter substrate-binding domain-containing protein, partial [Deltaproteobacteria bacterium]|nr:transporter substrate-binding domain-containing protein [Deltaproteobacteria bacterium]
QGRLISFGQVLFLTLVLAGTIFTDTALGQNTLVVKVGAYENSPKIGFEPDGKVSGFWPELLSYIAKKENFKIKYVKGDWDQGLIRLKAKKIDIMPDVAFTEKRAELFAFSKAPILMSWSRVYINKNNKDIVTIRDLDNKKIAALKGSVNLEGPGGLREICDQFNLNCSIIELGDYKKVFRAVEKGIADAGITNRNFGNKYAKNFSVKKTAIIFQPANMKFAFPRDSELTVSLAKKINRQIERLKSDDNSIYYQLLSKYFEGAIANKFITILPEWAKIIFQITAIFLVIFAVVIILLKTQVGRITKEINFKNKALIKSEKEYTTLFESIPDGVIATGSDGRVISANLACADILGCKKPEELVGVKAAMLYMNKKDRQKMLPDIMKEGYLKDYDVRIRRLDGEPRDLLCSFKLIKDQKGELLRINCIFRDITQKKILEKQLYQAQKMEAVGTLAGGIAHNFNNLLMGIQARTSLLLSEIDAGHEYFEHLEGIDKCAKDAADLTKQLLGYARGGKFEVTPSNINELVKDQSLMFRRLKKEINIQGKYEKHIWAVEIDKGQIKQVLMNLFVNACQAMPDGGGIYVQTRNFVVDRGYTKAFKIKPGNYVKISITDTGIGMDKDVCTRIFDPFFTTKRKNGGTGLGLASVYGIIKNHEGIINVYSEPGQGTTFNIYLPASGKKFVDAPEVSRQILKGKGTVLLVDDEKMIVDVGSKLIEKLGYKAIGVNSGKEAINIYRDNWKKIDIVIIDMIMPDMGGGELYKQLKRINPDILAILSSGYSINGQASMILDQGCDGFIQKPFGLAELSSKLSEFKF